MADMAAVTDDGHYSAKWLQPLLSRYYLKTERVML